jgi:hypothetical protein
MNHNSIFKDVLKKTHDGSLQWVADAYPDDPTTYFRASDDQFSYRLSRDSLVLHDPSLQNFLGLITNKDVGSFMLHLYKEVSSRVTIPDDLEERKLSDVHRF